jgi:hypothetical protein
MSCGTSPGLFVKAESRLKKPYTWVQSFIADDKIYCVHIAESKEAIREHSRIAKIPINTISEVTTTIDAATAST